MKNGEGGAITDMQIYTNGECMEITVEASVLITGIGSVGQAKGHQRSGGSMNAYTFTEAREKEKFELSAVTGKCLSSRFTSGSILLST